MFERMLNKAKVFLTWIFILPLCFELINLSFPLQTVSWNFTLTAIALSVLTHTLLDSFTRTRIKPIVLGVISGIAGISYLIWHLWSTIGPELVGADKEYFKLTIIYFMCTGIANGLAVGLYLTFFLPRLIQDFSMRKASRFWDYNLLFSLIMIFPLKGFANLILFPLTHFLLAAITWLSIKIRSK